MIPVGSMSLTWELVGNTTFLSPPKTPESEAALQWGSHRGLVHTVKADKRWFKVCPEQPRLCIGRGKGGGEH